MSEDDRRRLSAAPGRVAGTVMVDGTVLGTWWVERRGGAATGARSWWCGTAAPARGRRRAAVAREGHALLGLIEPGTGPRDVRFDPVA